VFGPSCVSAACVMVVMLERGWWCVVVVVSAVVREVCERDGRGCWSFVCCAVVVVWYPLSQRGQDRVVCGGCCSVFCQMDVEMVCAWSVVCKCSVRRGCHVGACLVVHRSGRKYGRSCRS
jgi:hypothetical protein